jgi:hypothetical protein
MSERIVMAAALKLELPGHTARLVDGGALTIGGESYAARDPVIGVAESFEALTEGVADEAPAGVITFLPPDATAASMLNDPASQGARCRLMITEVDADTGQPIGAVEQLADWIVDTTTMVIAAGARQLEVAFVSGGDRLFQIDRGNVLSPAFHRSVHPGEAGLDNASGVATAVAWGAASPARGVTSYSGGYGGGGGFSVADAV